MIDGCHLVQLCTISQRPGALKNISCGLIDQAGQCTQALTRNIEIVGTNNCLASLSKSVVVPLIPDLNFSAANTCEGSETILTNESISANDEITSTRWTLSDSELLSGNEVGYVFDQKGSYPVIMTVGTMAGCFYALSKNVTIYETPTANFSSSEESGTPPLAVNFENSSIGATAYSWQLNGMEFSTDNSPQKTFTELGDYVVDLVAISDKGCKDSKSMVINIIIPRTELALEQFNLIKEATTNLVRNQLVVKNNSNYKINEFDVLLDLGNGTTLRERISDVIAPGGTSTFLLSNSLVGVSSGYVCVELVIPNDLETENNRRCNPLQEVTILFNPSPNPAHDTIRLEIIAAEPTRALAWIVNSLGERVAEVPFDIETGLNVRSMDVSNLNPGLYFLVLEANGQKSVHRIVLQ